MCEKESMLNKKSLILMLFGIFFLFLQFGITVKPAQACAVSCMKVALGSFDPALSCGYASAFLFGASTACVVSSTGFSDLFGWAGTYSENPCLDTGSTSQQACAEGSCPTNASLVTGTACQVMNAAGAMCTGTVVGAGVFDSPRHQCVQCTGGGMGKVWGDSSGTYASPIAVCKEICGGLATSDGAAVCPAGCVHNNPTINLISASPQTVAAGTSVAYTISIANNDSSSCADTNFNLSLSGCTPWTSQCNVTSNVSLAPGSSQLTDITINSTVGTAPGSTANVTVTASGNGKTGTNSVTYIVAAAGALTVTFSPSGSISANVVQGLIQFTVKDGLGNPVSGASVDLSGGYTGSCVTLAIGKCAIGGIVSTGAAVDVRASAPGYTSGTTSIPVIGAGCVANTCNGVQYCPGVGQPWANCPIAGQTCQVATGLCGGGGGGVCGNGICEVGETAVSCPVDCAPCSGPGMFVSPLGPGYCSIGQILTHATNWILSLVSTIIILILIIGGLMYISSSGDEQKLRTSKNIIFYAVVGLGIILISYALITEVTNILKG